MKVLIWISIEDLENLYKAIKQEQIEDIIEYEFHEILIGEVQVSLDYEDYIRLKDSNLLYNTDENEDF
tara:strand:+ start:6992 stop:7195 length:204 start_codon:yes stop_codon:yes gene_type:complete